MGSVPLDKAEASHAHMSRSVKRHYSVERQREYCRVMGCPPAADRHAHADRGARHVWLDIAEM
jgi:hypothetical protein